MGNSTIRARRLRRAGTDAEAKLWQALRNRGLFGLKFRRQQPIGRYVVDFVCFDRHLVVEVDGGQHTPEVDRDRTRHLEDAGYRVVRFWNHDVLTNTDGVLTMIGIAAGITNAAGDDPRKPFPVSEA